MLEMIWEMDACLDPLSGCPSDAQQQNGGAFSGGGGGGAPVLTAPPPTKLIRPTSSVFSAQSVMALAQIYNKSNQCAELIDCIIFRESHIGPSGVPSGVSAGFSSLAGFGVHPAWGLMQLEPCKFGGPCIGPYDRLNPGENIEVGSRFLQQKINHLGYKGGIASYGTGMDYASHIVECVKKLAAGDLGGAYAAATGH